MSINIVVDGKEIKLDKQDYIQEGGEGIIYAKGGIVYKIYHNLQDVLPVKKYNELSVLNKDNILIPRKFIQDKKNNPIGFTMRQVSNTVPLARVFTTGYRDRNNITPDKSISLVQNMAETIQYIHEKNILIIDGNEFNYLIDGKDFIIPYFIDVNSYQTPSFKATVIMPSIRDWLNSSFTKESDWFSFAIIATQIFIGIHPFKGSHKDFDRTDLKGRMTKYKSIFNKEVNLPPITRDFGLIPTEYRDWFISLFEKGKRSPAPTIKTKLIQKAQTIIVTGKDKFSIDNIFSTTDIITGCDFILGNKIIYTSKNIYLNKNKYLLPSSTAGIIYCDNIPYLIDIENGKLKVDSLQSNKIIDCNILAEKKLIINNRLYIIAGGKFSEINIKTFNNKLFISFKTAWDILANSINILRNIISSDILGTCYLYIPYQENYCSIIPIPELNKHKIIDAKYENRVCVLITFFDSVYNRVTIKFNESMNAYSLQRENDIILTSVNFICLPNGVYLIYTGEGDLIIGNKKIDQIKILTNIKIDNIMNLCHNGNDVYYYNNNNLFALKMK